MFLGSAISRIFNITIEVLCWKTSCCKILFQTSLSPCCRSDKAGKLLAEVLLKGHQGQRYTNL